MIRNGPRDSRRADGWGEVILVAHTIEALASSSRRKFVGEFPVKREKLRLNCESDW